MKVSDKILYAKYLETILGLEVKTAKPVETIVFLISSSKQATAFKYVLTVDTITSSFLIILLALEGESLKLTNSGS